MITRYKYAAGGGLGSPYSHFSEAGPMWLVETITMPEWVDGTALGVPGSYVQRETEQVVFNLGHPFFAGNWNQRKGGQVSPGFSDTVEAYPEMEQPWLVFLMGCVEYVRTLEAKYSGTTRCAGSVWCGDIQDRIGITMRELGTSHEWMEQNQRRMEEEA